MGSNTSDFLLAALNDGAFLLCVAFIGYVLVIVVPFLRRKPARPGDGDAFQWHFVVPCLNEEAVISGTVRGLVDSFPMAHVWCVDDGSTDATGSLLAAAAEADSRVHVITRRRPRARQGKGKALNAGWRAIVKWLPPHVEPAEVIVGVVDADGRLDPDFRHMVAGPKFFANPAVGAVQINVRVVQERATSVKGKRSKGRLLVRMQDLEFAAPIAAMQTLRRRIGSVGMGGNGQFTRLSVLNRIAEEHGSPWHGALLEDFELGLHVLLVGSRTEYCHDTWVAQEGLPTLRGLVRQRSRWSQGSMQCFRYLWPVLRTPAISNTGAVEIAYFLLLPWLQLVGGLLYVACTGVVVWFALSAAGGLPRWFGSSGWGLLPLFVLFGLAPIAVWGPVYRATAAPTLSRTRALGLGLANWPYSYVHHVATWWAFFRFVTGRHDWKKTDRQHRRAPSRAVPARRRPAVAPPVAARRPAYANGGAPRPGSRAPAGPARVPGDRGESEPTEDEWDRVVTPPRPPSVNVRRQLGPSGQAVRRPVANGKAVRR